MELAQNGAVDEVFSRNIERQTEPSTFMEAFARHALCSFQFVRSVAKLIRKNLKEQFDVGADEKNQRDTTFSFPETPSLASQSSDDKPYHTHSKNRRFKTEVIQEVFKKQ